METTRLAVKVGRLEAACVWALALLAAIVVLRSASPRFIWDDDGTYLATARALATTGEYRLVNLPHSPAQTKYPPLYPALLATVWPTKAGWPAGYLQLKAVNAVGLALIVVSTWYLLRGVPTVTTCGRIVGAATIASAPALLAHAEQLVSDVWFTVFLIGLVLARATAGSRPAGLVLTGVLAALAALTRIVGLALVLGALLDVWATHGRRKVLWTLLAAICLIVPWLIWITLMSDATLGPLERQYVVYEQSLWRRLPEDPLLIGVLIWKNVVGLVRAVPDVLNVPTWWMVLLWGLLFVTGIRVVHRTALLRIAGWLLLPYVIVVIGHPYPMIRYLVPLVPIATVVAAAGFDRLVLRGEIPLAADGRDWLVFLRPTASIAMVLWLGANLIWIGRFPDVTQHSIHGGFGRSMPFDWRGFEQTFAWLRENTQPDAQLASAYGSLYFAFTGRRTVRPWFHEPDLYEPDYGIGKYSCQDVTAIHDDLHRLSIQYLIVDPQLADLDSAYGASCVSELLNQYPSEFVLEFTSAIGNHRAYRLAGPAHASSTEPRSALPAHPPGMSVEPVPVAAR
jgi:hypothetical protein